MTPTIAIIAPYSASYPDHRPHAFNYVVYPPIRPTVTQDLKLTVLTYLGALERSDWQTARALCADTATVWHNDGKGDETLDDYFTGVRGQISRYESIRYDIIRQFSEPGGVLQQHVVRVVGTDGTRGGIHAALHFGFDDTGLITRIEAYANYIPDDRSSAGPASRS
ncbi:nuclear transport factor 2 family protein [Rhodococcoides kyotonense]|uniref:nuclear transport factor 2 family protein n=1 Tax=Rhodococcoides kyotonense TaxID=398843 RepID=UPI001C3C30A4|nr:nuclear transport factor 2 family protein [Rhodococcus kyotonensis]